MVEIEDLCGRTVGEFVLRERIDEGGFGAVYRCEQPLLGREAVVKVLHQRLRRNDVVLQRFMREAQLASRLDHPYAAHVYAFGIEPDDGLFWIAMEMVQGIALNRWLKERGPLSLAQLVPFFDRVAEVVQTAHERGIVHRDLKPSNVMVIERAGRLLPKLLDFGIAKLLDEAAVPLPAPRGSRPNVAIVGDDDTAQVSPSDSWPSPSEIATLTGSTAPPPRRDREQRLTHADATIGSPPYMSPEQWNNAVTVGPASDLYALGVVAYEALTGRRPFTATSIAEYVDLHCNYPVPPLGDGFSPDLDRLFQRALAKRPEDRWATALELATALRSASGLAANPTDLPRLDDSVRDAWLAGAPQPLAESIAALDGARNAHQARDAAQELIRNLLRYLLAVALATRAQVREDRQDPALLDLVRQLRRRDLDEDERVRLLRLLVRPLVGRRGAHPIPELVDLVTPRDDDTGDELDPILALHPTSDHAGSEDLVRERLARLLPELATLLRKLSFALDYVLVVPRNGDAERWTGLRRQRRAAAAVQSGELVKHHPMLLDREGRVCVDLWPMVQVVSPTERAEPELFLFDGRGRNGARLIAAPAGFEHHDPTVWEWIATRVIADLDNSASVGGSDRAPYLGLTPFSTGDAARFVGRETEVDSFVNRLRQRPLQVVVGPSGAGKTSFIHAGVLPALPTSWRTVTLRPGAAPIAALAARLATADLSVAALRAALESTPATAAALVAQTVTTGTLVIVIDHLEELFTLCPSSDERLRFAAAVAELSASTDAPIRVIGAIRDDFLMNLDALAPLRAMLSPAVVLLGNPTRDALVRIVVEPARRAGYALSDPELATDMVAVVADRPGALALLSFTAARLWELRDRRFRQLTRNAYDAMGGIGGALGRHAEETLDGLSADEQRLAREIFRHLVTSEGTRALVTGTELRQRLSTSRADALIDKLVAARLLAVSDSSGEAHVEVIHDALIDAWPRLQQWVREDVDDARMRDQLRIAARQWQERSRSHTLLWRGDVLADLERWLRRPSARSLSDLESAFVAACRRSTRRLSRSRWAMGVLVVLAVIAAVQYRAVIQTRIAENNAYIRVTQVYIDQGRHALIDGNSALALLYLSQAVLRGDDSPTVKFMLARAAQPRLAERDVLMATSGRMLSAVFSPDGAQILTTDDKSARVWDAQAGTLLFSLAHNDGVYQAVYAADGQTLISGSADGSVRIWHAKTGTLLRMLTHKSSTVSQFSYEVIALSPDGQKIAALDKTNGVAHVWDVHSGEFLSELVNDVIPQSSPSLEFSADGRWLAMTGKDSARVFDTTTWKSTLTIEAPEITSLDFAPSGSNLATATRLGDASIWSVPSGTRVRHLLDAGEILSRIAFSPDGLLVAVGSQEGGERVWSAATGHLDVRLNNHHGAITSIDFDPTSKLVVSAGADSVVVVSDVEAGMPLSVLEGPRGSVTTAHFDRTSGRVVGASWDGTARVWNATSPYRRWGSQPIGRDCGNSVRPNEDGRYVAVSCTEHGTKVWDTMLDKLLAELPSSIKNEGRFNSPVAAVSAEGDLVAVPLGKLVALYRLPGGAPAGQIVHATSVTALGFAAGGHTLVSASVDGALKITRDGSVLFAVDPTNTAVDVASFLPDGRIVTADTHRQLRFYDAERYALVAQLELSSRIRAIRPSGDSRRLVTIPTTDVPAPPVLWDLDHYRVIVPLIGHTGQVFSARFQRGDREIVTVGSDGIARIWDGGSGRLRQSFFGSTAFLLDSALSPDGSMLLTAGGDGVVRFWEAASGSLLWTLRAHKSIISSVHFEGSQIVTRGFSGEMSKWELPPLVSPVRMEQLVRCLPERFDSETDGWVDQSPCVVQGNHSPG
jgi:WD40 repeat protein/serine/threonine protein kinase